jgi:hypothetical protein
MIGANASDHAGLWVGGAIIGTSVLDKDGRSARLLQSGPMMWSSIPNGSVIITRIEFCPGAAPSALFDHPIHVTQPAGLSQVLIDLVQRFRLVVPQENR